MGTGRKKAHQNGALLSNGLADPDTNGGRRKRAQTTDAELPAEKRPRSQEEWLKQQRRATSIIGVRAAAKADAAQTPFTSSAEGVGEGAIGKKKAKRLAVLQAKKAKAAQKKAIAEAKATQSAAEALNKKAKSKPGEMSQAASELLARYAGTGAVGEQRLLASVAERITAAPEKELELFDIFFELHRKGSDARTRQLALLSAVAVFRDLVPGYRIREPTEQEKAAPRSKQVLALERHELTLLQTYRRLLPDLEAGMKRHPSATAPALAALVKAACDFNYRQRLITTAVKHANSELPDVRSVVVDGLRDMVEGDRRLEASREVVLAVGRLAQGAAARKGPTSQGKSTGLQHELLQVLLQLPVGQAEQAALQASTGGLDVADEDIRRGLAEASINQSVEQLRKAEAELLYEVFVVYLRILRQRHLHAREMLGAVLTGLARWGQQVNVELLLEILAELRFAVQDAVSQGDGVVALQGLNCVLVLLGGPSRALLTDVSWLADAMTGALLLALPSLHSTHSESPEWPPAGCFTVEGKHLRANERELVKALEVGSPPALVLSCLDAALKCPQGYGRASDAALAALIEHLFLLAASADSHVALPLLREAATLLRKHHRLHTLMEVEGGIFGLGGVIDRTVSVVWQLQPLAFSLMPELARASRALPAAVPQRTASIAELFPARDGRSWLAADFPRHVCAPALAPPPRSQASSQAAKAKATKDAKDAKDAKDGSASAASAAASAAPFLTEAELLAACGRGWAPRAR